ncbi:hypothetical protein AgCh_011108 [Apium graveolens]
MGLVIKRLDDSAETQTLNICGLGYLGADCKNLGLGTPPAPPETSSGSPINGSNGASNNMKNIVVALIIALVFQHEFR